MNTEEWNNTVNSIISLLDLLKLERGYFSDPYNDLHARFVSLSVHLRNANVSKGELQWINNYAYRIVYEAPIESPYWKQLLDKIEQLDDLITK